MLLIIYTEYKKKLFDFRNRLMGTAFFLKKSINFDFSFKLLQLTISHHLYFYYTCSCFWDLIKQQT